ncbi:AMP-binding protein [Limnochorda pilosa]
MTLPQIQALRAREWGDRRPALREKEFGVWQEVSWGRFEALSRAAGMGFRALGLQPGEKVAVLADNIPEWFYTELGVQAVGGVVVGVYSSSVPREVAYSIQASDAVYAVAEDQEQVDKLLEVRREIPAVRRVIFEDPRGLRAYRSDPWLLSFEELLDLGRKEDAAQPGLFDDLRRKGDPGDVAVFCFSSGTTDLPKPVMLTHRNLVSMGYHFTAIEGFRPTDDYLSFLPLAWIGEQMMAVSTGLVAGFTVNCPEEVETVDHDRREIGPHLIFSPPRVWEAYVRQIRVKVEDSTRLKHWFFAVGMRVGERAADHRFQKRPLPWYLWLAHRFFRLTLYRLVQDRLGFLRLRKAYTAGAALGPDVFRFFHALGVNLKQGYGQTEAAGIFCFHRDDDVAFDTVGIPYPGAEVRISDEGEVLVRADSVCRGYHGREEESRELLEGGWLHSGDAGYLDERGHLVIIDRLRDVMRTASGAVFSPQFIENKLKFSHFIREAVVFGNELPYIAALVNIDPATVGKWAEDRKLTYTTYLDLSQKEPVARLIREEVERANATLKPEHRIRRFALLYKLLDADDEELTRTGKVRRGLIGERYRTLFHALYDGSSQVDVRVAYTYQDGRTAEMELAVPIWTVGDEALEVTSPGLPAAARG